MWWFGGRAAHSGPSLPYGLLHDLFADRFDIHDSDDPAAVAQKWERGVEKALGAGPRPSTGPTSSPSGSASRSATGPPATPSAHDPKRLSERATAHLAEYFRRLADQAPVVLAPRGPALGRRGHAGPDRRAPTRSCATAACSSWPRRARRCSSAIRTGARASTSTPGCRSSRCPARDPPPAGRDPPARRPGAGRAQRSRRDGVGGQPVLRRGAGEVAPRGRRHHQGRRRLARARGAPRTGAGARHVAQRAAGPARRAVDRRAAGAAAGRR